MPKKDDGSYTYLDAQEDRGRSVAVRQATPEQGYKDYVTGAASKSASDQAWSATPTKPTAGRKDR